MKKTKLLFLINTLRGGGAEKALINLLSKLNRDKYEITLLSVEGGIYVNSIPEWISYRQIVSNRKNVFNRIKKRIIYHLPAWMFNSIYVKGEFDCVIAYLEGFPTKMLARLQSKRKVAFVHCDLVQQQLLYNNKALTKSITDCYNKFDKVCFVSESVLRSFETQFGKLDNSAVIHNIINEKEICDLSQKEFAYEYSTSGLKIISIGRLEHVKGFDRLLNVVKKLETEYDFELWILGEGSKKKELMAKIESNCIKSVKLLGFQQNPYSALIKSDLFVCSSYTEGYSTTVNESLLLGVPVLTTDCSGMREIFHNGIEGIIVENSERGIENGIVQILTNKELYNTLKVNAVKYRDKDFNKRILIQIEQILGE